MTLGQRLAFYRKKNCLTQQQLGKMINVSAQAVSKWENDQAEPDVATICKLSEIYHISTDALLTGKDPALGPPSDIIKIKRKRKHARSIRLRTLVLLIILFLVCAVFTCIFLNVFINNKATLPVTRKGLEKVLFFVFPRQYI